MLHENVGNFKTELMIFFSRDPRDFEMEGTMTIQDTSDRHLVVFPHFLFWITE